MTESLSERLRRLAAAAPHVADFGRRQLIRDAARYGMAAAAMAVLTRHLAMPAFAADDMPAVKSIPDKLKGRGAVRVCSYGGALQDAQRKAYFKPFEELSGIKVIESEGPDPAKVKAMVDSGTVEFDVGEFDRASVINLEKKGDYWEPIDYSLFDTANIDAAFRYKLAVDMLPYAQIYAYRTDAFGGKVPKNNADLFDTKGFPGPRAMQSGSGGLTPDLEIALMGGGVPADKVYPIDIDKAFASLKTIKPDVVKWWTAGAMPAQMLTDNEVVLATAWSGRIFAVQKAGAPVRPVWQDQLLRTDAWAIPKGAANRENAQKFTAFITMAEPQARLSSLIPYGFVNNAAAELLSADRLAILPTSPDIKKQLLIYDTAWWAENTDAVLAKWNSFLLD